MALDETRVRAHAAGMREILKSASLLALLAAAAVGANPAAAQTGPGDLGAGARAAADRALADPIAWNVLESLTTEIGPRPVGSPSMTAARDWGAATLRSLGFENVHIESFTTPVWTRGPESASIVGEGVGQKLQILGLGRSTPTPPGGITAPIVLFRSYQEMLDQPPGSLAGKIAVVTQVMRKTQDGSGYGAINAQRTQGPVEAAKRGAMGYLVRSLSTIDNREPHAGGAQPGGIPAAALSPVDADQLERLVARGRRVSVRLDLQSTFNPAAEAWNVVGEIRGSKHPDEVIVVGGHLDSWDPGTGAIDDGAGVAILTAAARIAGAKRPERTIRVVMFGSEEQGGSGAAYGAAHRTEVPNIVVAGESDVGAGEIFSVSLPKNAVAAPAMVAFRSALPKLRVILSPAQPRGGGSDIEGLMGQGVPFVDFNQDATRYFDLHHSADDTLDKVDPKALAQNVAVWSAFIFCVANSDIDFRALSLSGAALSRP